MALDYPEEHRREGLIGTVVLHVLLALLFIFSVFNGPNPPLDSYETGGGGDLELNYGLDPEGYGDVQTTAAANASDNREDSKPPALSPDPQTEPVVTAQADPTPPTEERIITSDVEESPMSVPVKEMPAPPKEVVKETPKPQRKVAVTFSPNGSNDGGGNGTSGSSTGATGNNNGDRPGKVGDQGSPTGKLDATALYGTGGGGSGPGTGGGDGAGKGRGEGDGLDMAGWRIDDVPEIPKIDNNSGVARFKVVIDENGNIIDVKKISGSISPQQARAVESALRKATYRPTNSTTGGATGIYNFRYLVR